MHTNLKDLKDLQYVYVQHMDWNNPGLALHKPWFWALCNDVQVSCMTLRIHPVKCVKCGWKPICPNWTQNRRVESYWLKIVLTLIWEALASMGIKYMCMVDRWITNTQQACGHIIYWPLVVLNVLQLIAFTSRQLHKVHTSLWQKRKSYIFTKVSFTFSITLSIKPGLQFMHYSLSGHQCMRLVCT